MLNKFVKKSYFSPPFDIFPPLFKSLGPGNRSYYICCELLTEITECAHYLHGRNVIHRDLKPANILITDGINGRFVKLRDFGLSVIL